MTQPDAIGEWLTRLVGKFRYEGMVQVGECTRELDLDHSLVPTDNCQAIRGNSDCISIGDGPGVQCMLNVTWLDIFDENLNDSLVSYLDPAMELYGLDPRNSAISHLVVDNKGLAEKGSGTIKGNIATFRSLWVNMPVTPNGPLYRVVRIEARRDSELLFVRFGSSEGESGDVKDYAVMTLRRVQQDVPTEKSGID